VGYDEFLQVGPLASRRPAAVPVVVNFAGSHLVRAHDVCDILLLCSPAQMFSLWGADGKIDYHGRGGMRTSQAARNARAARLP
jgi:hypothetical protein